MSFLMKYGCLISFWMIFFMVYRSKSFIMIISDLDLFEGQGHWCIWYDLDLVWVESSLALSGHACPAAVILFVNMFVCCVINSWCFSWPHVVLNLPFPLRIPLWLFVSLISSNNSLKKIPLSYYESMNLVSKTTYVYWIINHLLVK